VPAELGKADRWGRNSFAGSHSRPNARRLFAQSTLRSPRLANPLPLIRQTHGCAAVANFRPADGSKFDVDAFRPTFQVSWAPSVKYGPQSSFGRWQVPRLCRLEVMARDDQKNVLAPTDVGHELHALRARTQPASKSHPVRAGWQHAQAPTR